jgi:hypothetical protein
MNRNRDFDETLKDWLDDGADHAPERYIWSALDDVERTAQRGAWLVSLEDLFVTIKLPALVLGTATVIIITALATYQLVGPNPGGPGASPSPSSSSQPAAGAFIADDLPNIVLTAANAPEGLTVDATETGETAFVAPLRVDSHPGGPFMDQVGFVDALMTNLNSTETGGYVSWSALFETAAGAEVAFDFVADEHGSTGWGMARSTVDPGLGDESASFTGAAYDIFETNEVYLWRVDNLVLAAVGVGDYDALQVRSIADLMDSRTR